MKTASACIINRIVSTHPGASKMAELCMYELHGKTPPPTSQVPPARLRYRRNGLNLRHTPRIRAGGEVGRVLTSWEGIIVVIDGLRHALLKRPRGPMASLGSRRDHPLRVPHQAQQKVRLPHLRGAFPACRPPFSNYPSRVSASTREAY